MTQALSIRPAARGERAALEALQRRASLAWEEYRAALLAHPDAIELPAAHIAGTLVAERDGAVAGFAVVLPRDDRDADLDGLFVEPHLWRNGIGRRLVAEAEALAARTGARVLHVIAGAHTAGFYGACGFTRAGAAATRFGPALALRKAIASEHGKDTA
jgi:GNAT superfamily N-acetyltransferase